MELQDYQQDGNADRYSLHFFSQLDNKYSMFFLLRESLFFLVSVRICSIRPAHPIGKEWI
ncbi:hypothetical protein CH371_11220 [Leptospira wolffii]|uniref:Uncharacterized protein n=1 Tax=Leptospira wolffii TaxID=409998 RepID=A0A2M9ZAR3_9LEPT|nr:hypothetical protein CH371_11220 [Leptospira wolffii]